MNMGYSKAKSRFLSHTLILTSEVSGPEYFNDDFVELS